MEALRYNNKKEKWLGTFKAKSRGSSKRFCNRKTVTDMGDVVSRNAVDKTIVNMVGRDELLRIVFVNT